MRSARKFAPASVFVVAAACGGGHDEADVPTVETELPPPLGVGTGATGLPPPVSGGHLDAAITGLWVAAADPDRDLFHRWDVQAGALHTTELPVGSEPGRVLAAHDGGGVVALRQAGQLAFIDPRGEVEVLVSVCAAPRGLAWDGVPPTAVLVACADGDLVTVDVRSKAILERRMLKPDLRDVVVTDEGVFVSVFRSAEVIFLTDDEQHVFELEPEELENTDVRVSTAWRMRAQRGGGVVVLHQLVDPRVAATVDDPPPPPPSEPPTTRSPPPRSPPSRVRPVSYGSRPASSSRVPPAPRSNRESTSIEPPPPPPPPRNPGLECEGAVATAFTELTPGSVTRPPRLRHDALPAHVLAVDFAVPARDWELVVADAVVRRAQAVQRPGLKFVVGRQLRFAFCTDQLGGQVGLPESHRPWVAVEMLRDGSIVAMSLEPPELVRFSPSGRRVGAARLAEVPSRHEGHSLFHADVGEGVACASCHPEAMDDGVAWEIGRLGPRRTHYLRGGIRGTAPFHWDGDMPTFFDLMQVTMGERMGAGEVSARESFAVLEWLEEVPLFPSPRMEEEAHRRGRALFEQDCARCHDGVHFGGVGEGAVITARPVQVPRLTNLVYRAPYMHNGCGDTLRDSLSHRCFGDRHGEVRLLDESEVDDLVRFLESL